MKNAEAAIPSQRRGVKSFRSKGSGGGWGVGGVKCFGDWGDYRFEGVLSLGEGGLSTPLHAMVFNEMYICCKITAIIEEKISTHYMLVNRSSY